MTSRNKLRIVGILVAALVGVLAIALPGTASARDRNHDKIPDKWERNHHLSLHKNQARRDQDRDQLKNRQEFKAGTNPRKSDTDGDGVPDGEENAGTIASFDGTTLTINLFNGGSVSGMVTDNTEIKCEAADNDNDQGDDNDDQGENEQGDENHAEVHHPQAVHHLDAEKDAGDNDDQGENEDNDGEDAGEHDQHDDGGEHDDGDDSEHDDGGGEHDD